MIAALIIIYLYVLIGGWLVFMAYRNAVAIEYWIRGSSDSVTIFKGILGFGVIFGGLMLVGWMESLA